MFFKKTLKNVKTCVIVNVSSSNFVVVVIGA